MAEEGNSTMTQVDTPAEEKQAETFEDAQDTSDIASSQPVNIESDNTEKPLTNELGMNGGITHIDNQSQVTMEINSSETQAQEERPHEVTISTTDMDDIPISTDTAPKASIPNPLDNPPILSPEMTSYEDAIASANRSAGDVSPLSQQPPTQAAAASATVTEKPPPASRTPSEGLRGKMAGGLSWFSRATTMRKPSSSPTRQPGSLGIASRRGTASSIGTLGSNPDTLGTIRDDRALHISPQRAHSNSLQDRFQAVRLQEEGGEMGSPAQTPGEEVQGLQNLPLESAPTSPVPLKRSPSAARTPTAVNSKLPPGTASGMSVGPATEDEGPVDWDLWQSVVYEGPAAVARTSGEELNKAIQSGIPQPIRGVVWQVLANSKNEELEIVYRELVAKGSEQVKSPPLSRSESNTQTTTNGEKESLASSASSIRSQASTPATNHSPLPTPNDTTNDTLSKVQESLAAEKGRRLADDTKHLQKLEKMIKRDLGARTSYSKYIASAGLQDGLFGICKAYALYDEAVGYAQGMNFIAMPLLFNLPEEEAFTLFVRLMSKYEIRSMFTADMAGLHLRLYQFERLLEDYEPALYVHLHRRGVSPTLYATQWFLTLFAYRFPLQLVLRVYDLILSQGLAAILKFGIVLMQKNAQTLLGMKDMAQLTNYLKEKLFDVYIDKSPSASSILESGFFGSTSGIDKEVYHADALVRDACAIDISTATLALYTAEWQEKQRIERDREHELESLRSANISLTSKVRNLEERAQQHDTEHVGIASELVRTKVENESLSDMNESLRMQVDELRKMVEAQPAEVEARLKSEMERIMARNMEVQNSNRALEDAMQEMEGELVQAKLWHAESKEENDALKQKLSVIQNMLGGK